MRRRLDRLRSPLVRHLPAALCVALVVEVGLRTMSLPRLCSMVGVRLRLDPLTRSEQAPRRLDLRESARYRAACRVVDVWPWGGEGKCLRRALVVGYLMRPRSPELHLGVARLGGNTVGHAWIAVDGLVLDSAVERYTALTQRAS